MKRMMKVMLSAVLVFWLMAAPVWAEGTDAAAPAFSAADVQTLLVHCTGIEGTAGYSLKSASRAHDVLKFCVENKLAKKDADALGQMLSAGYESLDELQKDEIVRSIRNIFAVADAAFVDYLDIRPTFEDADMVDEIEELVSTQNAYQHYGVFKMEMLKVVGAFGELFDVCTGYAGTAGSSLKNAIAAYEVLNFCRRNNLAYADSEMLFDALSEAYAQLSEESAQELAWNMESIFELIEIAFIDYTSVEGLFDTAGIEQAMANELGKRGVYGDWAVFCLQMQRVLNLVGE